MSNLKYKLLLCVVAVMLLSVPLYADRVEVWSWNFQESDPDAGWAFSPGSDWAVGAPGGAGGDPSAAQSDGAVLGNNLAGLYANGIATPETATTPKIDCSGQVGVTVTFRRWLTVEDSGSDNESETPSQDVAAIEVSNNGSDWHQVWMNPSKWDAKANSGAGDYVDDLVDTSWSYATYDISEWADGQKEAQIRWVLSSNGTTQFGGWNIDNITVDASAPDAVQTWTIDSATALADWTLELNWEVGAADVGTSGQDVDDDGNPGTPAGNDDPGSPGNGPDPKTGMDPAADADGDTFLLGYNIGGNYEVSMTAKYAMSPEVDCSGLVGTAVRFDRWLQVGDGAYDKATVQVHVDSDDDATIEPDKFVDDGTDVVLNAGTKTHVWTINASEFYDNVFVVKYVLGTLPAGHTFKIQYATTNTTSTVWTDLVTDDTPTPKDETETATSPTLPVAYSDGTFYIKASLNLDSGDSGSVTITSVSVSGINWKYAFKNASGTPLKTTLDEKWTKKVVDISVADGEPAVWFRFAMGPTDAFAASKYGGWSIDNIELIEASKEFRSAGVEAPGAMKWGQVSKVDDDGGITVSLQNTGTATWDSQHAAYEVLAYVQDLADPGNPGETKSVKVNQDAAIDRWGIGSIAVGDDDTVAPDDVYDFTADITAPPLSSIRYATPVEPTAPPDAKLSVLDADFALGNEVAGEELEFAPSYMNDGPATKGIVVTRFPDDQPGTAGYWALPWIEELAGGVPFVVQGYPSGKYEPLFVVDRASIAVYIQRAANVPSGSSAQVFHDVPTDHWAFAQINAVYAAEIVQGFADATYHPASPVTRDAMCKFIVNGVDYSIDQDITGEIQNGVTVPTMASLDSQPALDAYPFGDVDCFNNTEDPGPQVDERNPLANYILAAYQADIVQGYPVPAGSAAGTKPKFHPEYTITRDQLAVFVWRGFMRDFPSYVALGGPDITQAVVADDLTPTGPAGGLAPYSGFTSLGDIIEKDDDATAYVTLDAVRLMDQGAPVADDVVATFALTGGANPTGPQTVTISAAQVNAALVPIIVDDPDSDTDGAPFITVAFPLPIASIDHGTYKLVTTVNGKELARKPTLRVRSNIYVETMDAGSFVYPGWVISGQPAPPLDFYGAGSDAGQETNGDLKDGVSLQLQGTQSIQRVFPTGSRHDIRLTLQLAGVDFADDDTITVQWSKNGGAAWEPAFEVTGVEIADNLKDGKMSIVLPNGLKWSNPAAWAEIPVEHQNDLVYLGADDNANFAIRISIDGSTDARGYVDNIAISGT